MRNSKKSLLAGAVLASVLGCGFCVPGEVRAAQVDAVVGPKNFATLGGKEVVFGQKRGYVQNQQLTIYDEKPTWQIAKVKSDSIELLAMQSWGKNRFSDDKRDDTVQLYHYSEVLKYLEEKKNDFFSAEELSRLGKQTVTERWTSPRRESWRHNETVFNLPSKDSLNDLTPEQRKRPESYWRNNYKFVKHYNTAGKYGRYELWFQVGFVDKNGNYQDANGAEVKDFYPYVNILGKTDFAYYGDRSAIASSFQKQLTDDAQPLHVAFRNTQTEKDVQIKTLEIAADKIKFTADGLATGTGQGLGGILADKDGNYVSYARLADTTSNGRAENVTITQGSNKFLDSSQFATGDYTIYLFNEQLNKEKFFDYVGNFEKLSQVGVNDSGEITKMTLFGNRKLPTLTIPENITFDFTAVNFGTNLNYRPYRHLTCDAVEITDSLNWANVLNAEGDITLRGSFSVANDTLTLVRPTNLVASSSDGRRFDWADSAIIGWNDIIYSGGTNQTATLRVKGDMHGLIVNGGTFIAEKDLNLSDCLRVTNGATFIAEKDLNLSNCLNITNGATVQVNGKLNVARLGEINGTIKDVLDSEGKVTLKGSFSVANDTLTLVLPQGRDGNKDGWNDMIYDGSEGKTATLHVNGDMHGLIVNGGTFTAEKDLKLSDYLKINNGATVKVKGKLNVALSGEIKGTLRTDNDLDVVGFWHVYNNNRITAPNINIKSTLMLDQDATIEGMCNVLKGGTLRVVRNCFVKGLNLAAGSTLQVDGNKIQKRAAITYTTNIQAANDIKLVIDNQKEGVEYKIVEKKPQLMLMASGFGSSNSTPDLEKIVIPGYGMVLDTDGSTLSRDKVSVRFMSDPNIRKYCDLSNIITGVNRSEENLLWLKELEYKLNNSSGADRELLNNYVNTFANLNSLANVQGGLRTMSSLVTDSIQENIGLRTEGKYDKKVWASFIHNKEKIEGRKTGHLEQNSTLQYNGIVVGADLWKGEHGFGGVALHYGSGNFRDVQMITDVKNEADYYGISVYNRQNVGKFNIICDGGFTYAKNDISWRTVEGEYVLTKPKAMAYNLGFKVEEPVKLSQATELTPFAGLRYTFIKTKDYTDNYGDEFSADNQHLVNLPVGLTLKGTYQTKEGWELGGTLTGGYNWNLGNRNSTQRIEYAGFSDSMDFDTADRGEYFIRASLQGKYKNMAFELGYRYSKGSTSKDNRWNVNANFSF